MSGITSTSSYLSASSGGMAGLVSGMDTTTMVEEMLAGTKAKIENQEASKSQLEYQQEMYRDTATMLRNLQSSFFDFANSETNLMSFAFFNQYTPSIDSIMSNYLSIEAGSDYSGDQLSVDYIRQLATSTVVTSASDLTNATITGDIDLSKLTDSSMTIGVVGGASKEITLRGSTAEEVRANLASDVASLGITVEEDPDSGALSLTAGEGTEIEVLSATGIANMMTGLSTGRKGESLNVTLAEKPTEVDLTLNLDGISKTIKVDTSVSSAEELVANLNSSIKSVFGNGISVTASGNSVSFETVQANGTQDKSRQLTISSSGGIATDMLGITNGRSTKISTGTALSDINFTSGLTSGAGGEYNFSINGVDFSFTGESTLSDVIDAVNNSDAGVEMSYSTLSDRVTIERVDSGAGLDIEMSDTDGNLLANLFGTGGGVAATMSSAIGKDELIAPEGADLTVSFDIGSEFPPISINLAGKSISQVVEQLEQQIQEHQAPPEANVSYDPETGRLAITGITSYPVIITGSNEQASQKLAEMFGSETVTMNSTPATLGNKVDGQNAILSINGVETERSSNDFKVSGLQVELKETNWDGVSPKPVAADIQVDQDVDSIVDGILNFVEEYNKVIEEMNSLVTAEASYREYAPLTDDQKKEMTESEIELWEEKAREGLLRNDDILNGVMQDLRSILYKKPEGAEFALYEFGISTTSDWKDGGQLQVDEALLREMVAQHSDELADLFAEPDTGLAYQLEGVLDAATNTSTANPGSIVAKAGYTGMVENNYTLGREQISIEEYIERLEDSYEMEYDRYWSEFNAMEQMIANMNSQSSWLASQFA